MALEHIPEFMEPRFWPQKTAFDWGVFYREDGRALCLGLSNETITRLRCRILNDLFDDAAAYRVNRNGGIQ